MLYLQWSIGDKIPSVFSKSSKGYRMRVKTNILNNLSLGDYVFLKSIWFKNKITNDYISFDEK